MATSRYQKLWEDAENHVAELATELEATRQQRDQSIARANVLQEFITDENRARFIAWTERTAALPAADPEETKP